MAGDQSVHGKAEKLKTTEARAAGGDHETEMALIHQVQDLGREGSLAEVGRDLQSHGRNVKFDSRSGDLTDIDFGQISVHRMPDGDVTAIRRNESGHVAEIAYADGGALRFNYDKNNRVLSIDQEKIGADNKKTVTTTEANLDRQISVDHDGKVTLRGFMGNSLSFGVDGTEEIVTSNKIKVNGQGHGGSILVDSVEYPATDPSNQPRKRSFTYSQGEVASFTDPKTGETFERGTNYSDSAGSGRQYYHWKGDKGSTWDGTVVPSKDPGRNMTTQYAVTFAINGAMAKEPITVDVMSEDPIAMFSQRSEQ
jgi:hypothetical protein